MKIFIILLLLCYIINISSFLFILYIISPKERRTDIKFWKIKLFLLFLLSPIQLVISIIFLIGVTTHTIIDELYPLKEE